MRLEYVLRCDNDASGEGGNKRLQLAHYQASLDQEGRRPARRGHCLRRVSYLMIYLLPATFSQPDSCRIKHEGGADRIHQLTLDGDESLFS